MLYAWLAIPLLIAILDWFALRNNWRIIHAFSKQGVMVALIAWSWFATGWKGLLIFFGLALIFSWVGDVFLLSPKYFLPGMAAFLVAQIAYILGFNFVTPVSIPSIVGIVIAAALTLLLIYPGIRTGLIKKRDTRKLAIPVLIYGIFLSLMMYSAIATLFQSDWAAWTSVLMAAGGILFFISDFNLVRDHFIHPLPNGQLIIMITYHLAQIALITGAVLHFS